MTLGPNRDPTNPPIFDIGNDSNCNYNQLDGLEVHNTTNIYFGRNQNYEAISAKKAHKKLTNAVARDCRPPLNYGVFFSSIVKIAHNDILGVVHNAW